MKKALLCIITILLISTPVIAKEPFLGLFTTEYYPVDVCEVTKAGSTVIYNYQPGSIIFEKHIKRLKKKGFNAVVGLRIFKDSDGTKVYGTPVKVQCELKTNTKH
jgi:hypothetical protein